MHMSERTRTGRQEWRAAMHTTLLICACCLPIAWLVPAARPWMPLVLSTIWLRGPIGFLIPVGLEPVLMEYGARHPPLAVLAVAALASAAAETVSLRVMRGVATLDVLAPNSRSLRDSRVVRLFARQPGLAVAFGALSPVPDWITRSLAAVSGYSLVRYVLADTIGRTPKLWLAVAAGGFVSIDPMLTRGLLLSQLLLVGAVVAVRHLRSGRCGRFSVPASVEARSARR